MWNRSQKQFDQTLDRITNPNVVEHDFASVYELCDLVRSNSVSSATAFARLKKKLPPINRDYTVNFLALECLGVMAKNCGRKFHEQLGNQEFLQLIRDFISSSPDPYRSKALTLIQSWALGIEQTDRTQLINVLYLSLKSKGFSFPEVNPAELRALYQSQIPVEWSDGRCCFRCRAEFTTTFRKHHCRKCGQVVCHPCSSKRIPLAEYGIDQDVRVCDSCLANKAESTQKRVSDSRDTPNAGLCESVFGSDRKSFPSFLDPSSTKHGVFASDYNEDAELRLALELSRQEADLQNALRQSRQSAGETSKFYPDLKAMDRCNPEGEATGYGSAEDALMRPHDADYAMKEQAPRMEETSVYPQSFSPSSFASRSTSSTTRFQRYNPSAPRFNDAGSEFDANSQSLDNSERPYAMDEQYTDGHTSAIMDMVNKIDSKITLFNLRLRRNQSRSRSTANDQYARSLCISLTQLEPQLVDRLNDLEERRVYFESLQDKLMEIVEIRKALDELRRDALQRRLDEQGNQAQLRKRMLDLKRAELRAERVRLQPLFPSDADCDSPRAEDGIAVGSGKTEAPLVASTLSEGACEDPSDLHNPADHPKDASRSSQTQTPADDGPNDAGRSLETASPQAQLPLDVLSRDVSDKLNAIVRSAQDEANRTLPSQVPSQQMSNTTPTSEVSGQTPKEEDLKARITEEPSQ